MRFWRRKQNPEKILTASSAIGPVPRATWRESRANDSRGLADAHAGRAKNAVVCGKDGAVAAVSPKGNPAEDGSCVSPKGMKKKLG
jgi:hypothetical protein